MKENRKTGTLLAVIVKNSAKKIIIFFLLATSVLWPILSYAQVEQATQDQLQQQLKDIEVQIADLQKQLSATTGEKKTLANKIKQLQKEQASLKLKIKQTTLQLNDIQKKLTTTKQSIAVNETKSERLKNELAVLIREMDWKDQEIFLFKYIGDGGLGGAFLEIKAYQALSHDINVLAAQADAVRETLTKQKTTYQGQQDDKQNLLKLSQVQQAALIDKLQEQGQLLSATKGKEATYQSMLTDQQKLAAQIRNRLYQLFGVSTQINFGQAVTIAQSVSAQTNVPAAFLLAILTQESNLGGNVGTCNRPGDPPEKSWKVVMKPNRDQEPFKIITSELGRDPDITPVSCPMKNKDGSQMGWGGAMGPAQFIPSTWMGYRSRVTVLSGKSFADPWDVRDAFIAAALLLKNNGADNTADGQWKAAMRYFSGGTNVRYRFYGDNVLTLAKKYEQDIKDLAN